MDYRPTTRRAEGVRHLNTGPNPNQLMLPGHTRVSKFVRPAPYTGPVLTATLSPAGQRAAVKVAARVYGAPSSAGRVKR